MKYRVYAEIPLKNSSGEITDTTFILYSTPRGCDLDTAELLMKALKREKRSGKIVCLKGIKEIVVEQWSEKPLWTIKK